MIDGNRKSVQEYIAKFDEEAIELSRTKVTDCPKCEERKIIVDDMIEDHIAFTGRLPNNNSLTRLADYLLLDELKDKDVDKVSNNEFPILSATQLKRRDRKQFPMEAETMDFLNTKYNKRLDSLARTANKEAEY